MFDRARQRVDWLAHEITRVHGAFGSHPISSIHDWEKIIRPVITGDAPIKLGELAVYLGARCAELENLLERLPRTKNGDREAYKGSVWRAIRISSEMRVLGANPSFREYLAKSHVLPIDSHFKSPISPEDTLSLAFEVDETESISRFWPDTALASKTEPLSKELWKAFDKLENHIEKQNLISCVISYLHHDLRSPLFNEHPKSAIERIAFDFIREHKGEQGMIDLEGLLIDGDTRGTLRGMIESLEGLLSENRSVSGGWDNSGYPGMVKRIAKSKEPMDPFGLGGGVGAYNIIPGGKPGACQRLLVAFSTGFGKKRQSSMENTLKAINDHLIRCDITKTVAVFFDSWDAQTFDADYASTMRSWKNSRGVEFAFFMVSQTIGRTTISRVVMPL